MTLAIPSTITSLNLLNILIVCNFFLSIKLKAFVKDLVLIIDISNPDKQFKEIDKVKNAAKAWSVSVFDSSVSDGNEHGKMLEIQSFS